MKSTVFFGINLIIFLDFLSYYYYNWKLIMMNLLSAKQQSINNNMLQTSLERDLQYALGKKPSLDGLSTIQNTPVDGPFLGVNNLKLGKDDIKVENIVKQNGLVDGQIANLKNEVLNSNNVANVVEMNYQNNNGVENGYIRRAQVNSLPNNSVNNNGNMVKVQEEVVNIPTKETVVNSFIIDLDADNDISLTPSATWELNTPSHSRDNNKKNNLEVNNSGEEIYHGVKSVEPRNNNRFKEGDSWERSFGEMLGKFRTNKIILVLFLVVILVVIFLMKGRK